MNFKNAIKVAFQAILANKMRSFLTMLGVIIGVFAVITLVAIGQGSSESIKARIESMGSNLLVVNVFGRGTENSLTYSDAKSLREFIGIQDVAPVVSSTITAKNEANTMENISLEGIDKSYFTVCNYSVASGRSITSIDVENRLKVAILGSAVVEELYNNTNPIGKNIKINGSSFKIVGVLEEKGSSLAGNNNEKILIPVSTAERFFKNPGIRSIYIQAADAELVEFVQAFIEDQLNKKFKDEEAVRIFNQSEILETVNEVTRTMTMMLGGIAAISLLVGGIGIMNIMLVSVTERTAEIGIRKAVGAKRRDILAQFLVESAVISGIGGLIGIMLGIAGSYLLENYLHISSTVSIHIIIVAFAFSLAIGIFFGIFPANRAASLSPVEALREE